MMKQVLLILALASITVADFAPGLRLRWGLVANSSYFIDIPRQVDGIIEKGWTKATQPEESFFPCLTLYCPTEPYVCALYDDAGYIAGLQVAIPQDADIKTPWTMESLGYFNWTHNNVSYYAVHQYYVTESYLAKSVSERQSSYDHSKTLQEDAVWFPFKTTGELMKVGSDLASIDGLGFVENTCVQTQGTHYQYDSGENCDDNIPFFLLVNNGQVVGTGWWSYLHMDDFGWFEYTARDFYVRGMPNSDACVLTNYDSYGGAMSMHIFYVDQPQTIVCDSTATVYPPTS